MLLTVTDSYNHSLGFTYDSQARIATLTDPAGGVTRYAYDAVGNLANVTYPDNTKRTYVYNEQANTANTHLPHALTGIIDENNRRYATFKYQADGKAISSEHAGGVEKYQLAYSIDSSTGQPVATITDPLGAVHTRRFTTVQGMVKSTGQDQPQGRGGVCPASANSLDYDSNGNVARRADFNGNTTCYAYDTARNLETVRVEGMAPYSVCPANLSSYVPAANTAERKITTQWHGTWRVPTYIAEPNRVTRYLWADGTTTCGTGATGVLCSKTVYATHDSTGRQGIPASLGGGRTWQYGYNSLGQMTSANGPRGDTTDITRYAYYAANDPTPANRNQLKTISHTVYDAANQPGTVLTTTYSAYNAHGRPETVTNPAGVAATLTYTRRGQLHTITANNRTTTFDYLANQLLDSVTNPATGKTRYGYDAAHRLTSITNANGESVTYVLDKTGNRTQDQYRTGGSTPTVTQAAIRKKGVKS